MKLFTNHNCLLNLKSDSFDFSIRNSPIVVIISTIKENVANSIIMYMNISIGFFGKICEEPIKEIVERTKQKLFMYFSKILFVFNVTEPIVFVICRNVIANTSKYMNKKQNFKEKFGKKIVLFFIPIH